AKGNPKVPPAERPKRESAGFAAKEGVPKGTALKGEDNALKGGAKGGKLGPPVVNPNNPLFRLYTATPEQRERALEKLNPRLQEGILKQLEAFDRMPKEMQDATIRMVQ